MAHMGIEPTALHSWSCTSFLIPNRIQIFDRTIKIQFASPLFKWVLCLTTLQGYHICKGHKVLWGIPTQNFKGLGDANTDRSRKEVTWIDPSLWTAFYLAVLHTGVSDLKQLLAWILFRLVTLGQPRLEVVGLGCWQAEKTKILEWQRKVCSVERMEMLFSSEVDSVRRQSLLGRYLDQF